MSFLIWVIKFNVSVNKCNSPIAKTIFLNIFHTSSILEYENSSMMTLHFAHSELFIFTKEARDICNRNS